MESERSASFSKTVWFETLETAEKFFERALQIGTEHLQLRATAARKKFQALMQAEIWAFRFAAMSRGMKICRLIGSRGFYLDIAEKTFIGKKDNFFPKPSLKQMPFKTISDQNSDFQQKANKTADRTQ